MFPERIETERLALTPVGPDHVDLDTLYRICSSDPDIEDVTRYVRWSPHETKRETREFLANARDQREAGEGADYVIRPRADELRRGATSRTDEPDTGDIAGLCGLVCDWDRRSAELGMWLRKRFWGRGYSGERAAALLAVAFEGLDLEIVAVDVHVDNEASRRAVDRYISRFGGRREGVLRNRIRFFDGSVHDAVRYTVSRGEWRATIEDDPVSVRLDGEAVS